MNLASVVSRFLEQGEAKLPGTGPSQKGISLDDSVPGELSDTFKKPEDDIRDDSSEDESIFRRDRADDLLKDQTTPDTNETNEDAGIGYAWPGKQDDKPKLPYRDDKPHSHTASLIIEQVSLDKAHTLRMATKLDGIESGLNPKVEQRAGHCSVSLKRADRANMRWIFSVDSGNGPKLVKLHATRQGNATKMGKMDLHLSCSCPAWRWLGPEHHAKRETYLNGQPRGTASIPRIRDPENINRVCKHVAAVLNSIRQWTIPTSNKK